MTQALSLAHHLRAAGHTVQKVFVATAPHLAVPQYFRREVDADVETVPGASLVPGPDARGVHPWRTAAYNVSSVPRFLRRGLTVHHWLDEHRPDVLVDFLDVVGAATHVLMRNPTPRVCVGHNYFVLAPGLSERATGPWTWRWYRAYLRLGALGATRRMLLCYDPEDAVGLQGFEAVPPLLRPETLEMEVADDGYLLAYALNAGYADVLADWHRRRPDAPPVRCFVEGGLDALERPPRHGFTAHELDSTAYRESLARCRGLVCSAGFEAIAEAFYLGKPTLVVPTEGSVEQRLNALDAQRHGAARRGSYADLDTFVEHPPHPDPGALRRFRAWVRRGPGQAVDLVERAAT
jgi:uncharacterized protein (TIGR00661 family)